MTKIVMHPGYNDFSFENDIAALRVDRPFELNENVAVICPPEVNTMYTYREAIISGWGNINTTGKENIPNNGWFFYYNRNNNYN